MKYFRLVALFFALSLSTSVEAARVNIATVLAATQSERTFECVVADPTGTPLNVRERPNGRIVGKLKNGTKVRIVDAMDVERNSRSWLRISVQNKGKWKALGWVVSDYITGCNND